MKVSFFIGVFLLVFLSFPVSAQNTLNVRKETPPIGTNSCATSCIECSKLIFSTFVSDLTFESNPGNIKEQVINREVSLLGDEKFIHHIVIIASKSQNIVIKGPNVVDCNYSLENLEPGGCYAFFIDIGLGITTPEKENAVNTDTKIPIPDTRISVPETTISKDKSAKSVNKDSFSYKIRRQEKKQTFWIFNTILTGASAGYFKYSADKKYKEYLKSTDSDESAELKETIQLYDKITYASAGAAVLCTLEFTIHSAKKGRLKRAYNMTINGQGARFAINF